MKSVMIDENTRTRMVLACLVSATLAVFTNASSASIAQASMDEQQHARVGEASDDRQPAPTRPRAVTIDALDEIRPGQEPLLREGSALVQVRGRFHHEQKANQWHFLITRDDADLPGYRLTMLPNRYLSEIEQVIDASRGSEMIFELSGKVFVYRQHNYLLVTSPPRVVGDSSQAASETEREHMEFGETEPPSTDLETERPRDRPRGARDIMDELEREAGELARAMPHPTEDWADDEADEDRGGKVEYRDELLSEGTSIVQRRGRISREAGGAWKFVFDADASGLADPPMTLLPCLLLERIERFARRNSPVTPVLMSGQVFTYEGRNYLLPSQFIQPLERTTLMP